MSRDDDGGARRRVVVLTADPAERARLTERLDALPGIEVAAWAEDADALLLLGVRADVCICATAATPTVRDRLRGAGLEVRFLPPGADPADALDQPAAAELPGVVRPQLAARQREVLVAVVAGNDLLTAVARRLGVNEQTIKTHLRRIRSKYSAVGRPAPTRRDLYVRAVEDGLIPPPGTERRT